MVTWLCVRVVSLGDVLFGNLRKLCFIRKPYTEYVPSKSCQSICTM